jgi:hypothetical protein
VQAACSFVPPCARPSRNGLQIPARGDGAAVPGEKQLVRYQDLSWRGWNLGELVATLTEGRQRRDYRAHLDPDLRAWLTVQHLRVCKPC